MNAILASGPFVALGWLLVVLVCIFIIKLIWKPVVIIVGGALAGITLGIWNVYDWISKKITNRIKHYKTRNTLPAINQRWMGFSGKKITTYWINNIMEKDGVMSVHCGSFDGWAWLTMDEWKDFVRKNRMFLSLFKPLKK